MSLWTLPIGSPRLRHRAGNLVVAGLLLAAPAFGEGLGEVFSPGGMYCPASDADLDSKPTPPAPDFANLTPIDPVYLDWPATANPQTIIPLGVDSSSRYFNFNNSVTVMVGVSADAACHLHLGTGSDMCTFDSMKPSYYKNVLSDAKAKGLNKIRLVVALNGIEPDFATSACYKPVNPDDQPFEYVPGPGGALGYWRLDTRNEQFFRNLRNVVQLAGKGQKKLFVEVTFFAPWWGVWEYGPWNENYGRVGNNLEHVGFTSRSDFVRISSSGDPAPLARVRQIQKDVIHWTIDALWDQPHIYWEIANEPENPNPTSTQDCDPTKPPAVDAAAIKSWQEMMINEVVTYEAQYVNSNRARKLKHPHLIAVQPYSQDGVSHYVGNPNVSVINGHYTRVDSEPADLGAIALVRFAAASGRVIGFNEGKISGISGPQGTANGGGPNSARAEAWEFALNRGAAFDHFGYNYSSTNGGKVRDQLGRLRSFLTTLPLRQLTVAADPPNWISLETYDVSRTASSNFTYWAALEPKPNATGVRTYVAYIHHSKSRQLGFDGYEPIPKDTPPYYSANETYKLCFGSASGTYEIEWICPEKNEVTGSQTLQWSASTCVRTKPPNPPDWSGWVTIQPPVWPGGSTTPGCHYTYDILLRIRKTG